MTTAYKNECHGRCGFVQERDTRETGGGWAHKRCPAINQ